VVTAIVSVFAGLAARAMTAVSIALDAQVEAHVPTYASRFTVPEPTVSFVDPGWPPPPPQAASSASAAVAAPQVMVRIVVSCHRLVWPFRNT
jgi:alkanesulfonate monooxygenase SsuD/methylene tetrahydromethanopterin reductase-like flavin-dependent oxidoreductase (luciferase family)